MRRVHLLSPTSMPPRTSCSGCDRWCLRAMRAEARMLPRAGPPCCSARRLMPAPCDAAAALSFTFSPPSLPQASGGEPVLGRGRRRRLSAAPALLLRRAGGVIRRPPTAERRASGGAHARAVELSVLQGNVRRVPPAATRDARRGRRSRRTARHRCGCSLLCGRLYTPCLKPRNPCAGYNTGFASGRILLESWAPDLCDFLDRCASTRNTVV